MMHHDEKAANLIVAPRKERTPDNRAIDRIQIAAQFVGDALEFQLIVGESRQHA
ncbi:hypothetical protein GA0070609_3373 [Micromonospora echinaurantiaca]|uniref:Uncharacterized protein n=1 Tax=Micromonospora echinaurantiaca TaxID=47857 RepID=A0A1C5IIK4_9ACTN|nr:hypothetical protein GA0070609_3373 [Micromonospora echinaurantiaca]